AHSKGGLIGKQVLLDDAAGVVEGMIALNTPFSGAARAKRIPLSALKAFLPGSRILESHSMNQTVNSKIVSVYSRYDQHVPEGSKLYGATNILVNAYGHHRIVTN